MWRLSFSPHHPRTISLGDLESLQLFPCPRRLISRSAFLRSHEVAHEVDVSPMRNLRESLFGLIQANIFSDQVFIGELDAPHELFFAPTIEPISNARFPFHPGR